MAMALIGSPVPGSAFFCALFDYPLKKKKQKTEGFIYLAV